MVKFNSAYIAEQFQEFHLFDDTNYLHQIFSDVVVIEIGSDSYFLPNGKKVRITDDDGCCDTLKGTYHAPTQLEKVIERGDVNLDYWTKIEDGPSLQEILEEEFIIECEDRARHGCLYL